MLEQSENPLLANVPQDVTHALAEDIGSGDITAELIPAQQQAHAKVICRENATICGQAWVTEVFDQIDSSVEIKWHYQDGEQISAGEIVFEAMGSARSLLTAERSALNFLQTLSSVASSARVYADLVKHTPVKILDTRKTIPGLRLAQKYAVTHGGCFNHRIGLYDAFLIKENHINACGGIAAVIHNAQQLHPNSPVEIEVESLDQLEQALSAGADVVMLDNFSFAGLRAAVKQNAGRAKLEASGGYDTESIVDAAETGVDLISVGSITKNCQAVDFSMLFES